MTWSISTNLPPYHNNTAIVIIPNISLTGPAKLFLSPMLLESLRSFPAEFLKFSLKIGSAL